MKIGKYRISRSKKIRMINCLRSGIDRYASFPLYEKRFFGLSFYTDETNFYSAAKIIPNESFKAGGKKCIDQKLNIGSIMQEYQKACFNS